MLSKILGDAYEASLPLKGYNRSYYGEYIKEIGRGSYGIVYLTSKSYAIKEIVHEEYEEIPLREISAIRRINNPYIISFYDLYINNKTIVCVMDIADNDLNKDVEKLNIVQKDNINFQLMCAMSYLYRVGIIHRDLNPRNILLFFDDNHVTAKIADFGVCKSNIYPQEEIISNYDIFNQWYRPPEVFMNLPYIFSADWWSLGCIIYYLYSGKHLFQTESEFDTLQLIFTKMGLSSADIEYYRSGFIPRTYLPLLNKNYPTKGQNMLKEIKNSDVSNIISFLIKMDPNQRKLPYYLLQTPYYDNFQTIKGLQDISPRSCASILQAREWYPIFRYDKLKYINHGHIKTLLESIFELWHANKHNSVTYLYTCFLIDWVIPIINPELGKMHLYGFACFALSQTYNEQYSDDIDLISHTNNSFTIKDLNIAKEKILEITESDLIFSISLNFKNLDNFRNYDELRLMTPILYLITICKIRFEYLPSEQYDLSVNIVKYISKSEKIDKKWIKSVKYFLEDIESNAITKYAEVYLKDTKYRTENFVDMIKN